MRRITAVLLGMGLALGLAVSLPASAGPAERANSDLSWLAPKPEPVCVNTQRLAATADGKGLALLLDSVCTSADNTRIPGCCDRRYEFCVSFCSAGIQRFTCVEVQNGCSSHCKCNPPPV